MKKICFLGIMLIAAHSIASAQLSVNLDGGTGLWMATCNNNTLLGEKVTSPNITPTFYVGALLNNTLQSGVTLEAGVNFHLLTANGSYKSSVIADDFNEGYYRKVDFDGEGHSFGDAEGAANFFQVSVPLRIGYNFGKIAPNVGIEYDYRISQNTNNYGVFGVTAGLQYKLTDRLALTCNYFQGMTTDLTVHSNVKYYDTTDEAEWKVTKEENDTHKMRSCRLDVGVSYRLGKSE